MPFACFVPGIRPHWENMAMRVICLVFLLAFAGAVAFFAYQNQQEVTLTFWDRTVTTSIPLVAAGCYLLGMLSGWTIVGLLRRSVVRVFEGERREYAHH
jgi:hypothetical protein